MCSAEGRIVKKSVENCPTVTYESNKGIFDLQLKW